ncbi:MAG: alpha/beta hydrolase, partial [Hyphomonas sp.]|nr:alpha/beta hydrolase [Hyphomonas sp.]
MWLFKLIVILAAAYVVIVAVMYAAQTQMLFPTGMASAGQPFLPASAARLEFETSDGDRLHGVHIGPAETASEGRSVVLGFGGNAWNADDLAAYLHGLFPDDDVVAFHYRGYRPSTGRPSAAALLPDAPVVYDQVIAALDTERVVAVGFSIGSGVAAHLASRRPLAGLILVSPFDSLEALVREHYPWVPVRWLLRHHMSPLEDLQGLPTPTALIAAERDTIIPPRRTEAVQRVIPALVLDQTITDANHNDLYG